MERSTYPFPLAVNSSHHSHYHRFLLGVDAATLAPFPKPYCVGALAGTLRRLAENLNLQQWRKLYHAAIPWTEGFGPGHYDLGNVPAHRPLPREYGRPVRRYGAYDFVQIADPCVSALALVAGDRRVLDRFVALGDDFCRRIEEGACARGPGHCGPRATGRMLAGQFAEPNNRWLMPFLHVHARVLNFTSFKEAPDRLACIDPSALASAGRKAKLEWIRRQAEALSDLGYRVKVRGDEAPALEAEGVSARLVAAMEAPRIAVLRLLERMIVGDRPPSAAHLGGELPPAVIAAMAEELESILSRSLSPYKPRKMGLPSEGPWRGAVREHLSRACPGSLAILDAAAARARADVCETPIFSTPAMDPAHRHAPGIGALEAAPQLPTDPELGAGCAQAGPERMAPSWLVREFEETLGEVNDRIVRAGPDDPLVSLGRMLSVIDQLSEGAEPEQLRQAGLLLGVELERRARDAGDEPARNRPLAAGMSVPLASLEDLFEDASLARGAQEQEIGGRSR